MPFSTSGRSTSCCALLNRWISSINKSVALPELARRLAAVARTRRISETLDSTPLNLSKRLWVRSAITCARLVLPVPGGPKKISDWMRSASMARLNSFPGARMWLWPTYSLSERGRILAARGW